MWFPCAASTPRASPASAPARTRRRSRSGSPRGPIAQARAAVATALLDDDLIRAAHRRGRSRRRAAPSTSSARWSAPTVPGRADRSSSTCSRDAGIIPLEAARLGATRRRYRPLAGGDARWPDARRLPAARLVGRASAALVATPRRSNCGTHAEPRLIRDLRVFLEEVGRRVHAGQSPPLVPDEPGRVSFPWGYLWAVSYPVRWMRPPLPALGSLVLRHPHAGPRSTRGRALRLVVDGDHWRRRGRRTGRPTRPPPTRPATAATAATRKGKSARCIFCSHVHSLETVKAKGFAGEYEDELLATSDNDGTARRSSASSTQRSGPRRTRRTSRLDGFGPERSPRRAHPVQQRPHGPGQRLRLPDLRVADVRRARPCSSPRLHWPSATVHARGARVRCQSRLCAARWPPSPRHDVPASQVRSPADAGLQPFGKRRRDGSEQCRRWTTSSPTRAASRTSSSTGSRRASAPGQPRGSGCPETGPAPVRDPRRQVIRRAGEVPDRRTR